MTAYVDSSVVLRIVLAQPDALAEWSSLDRAVTSELTEVECLRSLDRRYRQGLIIADDLAARRGLALRLLGAMERIGVTAAVLSRAADPFPTPLGTLDAIHLATAILWRDSGEPAVLATHDGQLATAAKAVGFTLLGAP